MMSISIGTPWHKESFDHFLEESLPQLLADRLPLAGYEVKPGGKHICTVRVAIGLNEGEVAVEYADIPQPDADGLFERRGKRWVVVPTASHSDLDTAEVSCVGEQMYAFVEERLGKANGDLPWDKSLVRAWLPLDAWIEEFFTTMSTAQVLDDTNWLSERCHLRRILVPSSEGLLRASHFGRTCPLETPEGPNIGKVLSIAVGAAIRDGKVVITDDAPEAGLGVTAEMVPLLEYDDANRALMGVNMMRQWLAPEDPEPALVQTGNEPDAPRFWCGRNLLTAYISLGGDTFEDGIVVSESCAERLAYPKPLEPGDKLSNRHGTKGTVTRIIPDEEMPHLPDGTAVDLVFSFIGCQTRLNIGQIRETVLSRIARAEGKPAIVPPFLGPKDEALREQLRKAGLPESGMETLTLGRGGEPMKRPSTVGWVYWGKTCHTASVKIHTVISGARCQRQGELEYYALRDMGAVETILEYFNTRCADRDDAPELAERVARGPVEQAPPPTPQFLNLAKRLDMAGIKAEFSDEKVAFRFDGPDGPVLRLAAPVPHPWLREREVTEVGVFEELREYRSVAAANAKVKRMVESKAPESLVGQSVEQLAEAVRDFFDALVCREDVRPGARVMFSGRTVLSVGPELRMDQLGIPAEMAWTLFGPMVAREVGGKEVENQTERAAEALDRIMAESWVILNRAPTFMPTSLIAFHPVRHPERVIRIHPSICMPMNADFDGDQAAVLLPITEAGQKEAGEVLSVAGHLKRDPDLLPLFCPRMEAVWGLADLSRSAEGVKQIEATLGEGVKLREEMLTAEALASAVRRVMERDGVEEAMRAIEELARLGLEVARESGASMSPFIGESLSLPPQPEGDGLDEWIAYLEECGERIASRTDYDDPDLGPQLLAAKAGARGTVKQLAWLICPRGMVIDVGGKPRHVIRSAVSDGMTPEETYACVIGARKGLASVTLDCTRQAYNVCGASPPKGFNVLARAMRAKRPGVVFASAAAAEEVDPLRDVDSRLFVGLKPL